MKINTQNFTNHKAQAFYISVLIFAPLMFFFINIITHKVIRVADDKFALSMKQFIINQEAPVPVETPIIPEIIPPEPIPQPVIKPKPKPIKKIVKKKKMPSPKPVPIEEVIETPPPPPPSTSQKKGEQMQNLNFSQDDNPFLRELKQAIDAARTYPRQARKMRMQGQVLISFVWLEEKFLRELKILKSSGYKILDENALQTIKTASARFPSYEKGNVRIEIPIDYRLH